jgi:hypothetical protein
VDFESPSIFDEPIEDEDVTYGDMGEILVIRRVLNSSMDQDEI